MDFILTRHEDGTPAQYPHILSVPVLNAIAWTFTASSLLIIVGKIYLRWRQTNRFYSDDFLSAAAGALLIPFIVAATFCLPIMQEIQLFSLGLILDLPSAEDVALTLRMQIATLSLSCIITYAVKASFLALYWRVYCHSRRVQIVLIALTAVIALFFVVNFLSIFWSCGSPAKVGNLDACTHVEVGLGVRLLLLWCILNAIGTVLVMLFPIGMIVSGAYLGNPQMLGLVPLYALAISAIALGIMRTVWSLQEDLSKNTNLGTVWTYLEPIIAVVVCALPTYGAALPSRGPSLPLSDDELAIVHVEQPHRDFLEMRSIRKRHDT